MANLLTSSHLPLKFSYPFPSSTFATPRNVVALAVSSPERKTRRRRRQKQPTKDTDAAAVMMAAVSTVERGLRLAFMEELMGRARDRDVAGVSEVIYDMIAAGISPGPRSFHGLIVSHVLTGDVEGAMHALRRELSEGLRPLHETFVALIRLFGSKGRATRGLEILAAMEKLHFDIRQAWLVLVEELVRSNHLEDANKVFLKGAEGGLRATDELYDRLIEEDCKVGDHSNALTIAYEMEAAGRMATTFHFNCLLSVQATCGIPEIALATFENMEYGEDHMKPDTETYNWVIQAYTRAESYDRVQDVAELLGMMIEDHKRLQPNVKTYALLVECFTKYCVVREAIRHFRALKNIEGGTKILHNEGKYGDPLSLYLRALCREGRVVELLEALEAMAKDNQQIPPRAMILSRKYRTLVSSWIEPLQEEAELGYEIDYISRYNAEGGLTGERKRWVPRRGKTPLDPDALGFIYNHPIEASFKQRCLDDWKMHHRKLLKTLYNEGPLVLGDVSETDYIRVENRLKKIIKGPDQNALKPKAASKMRVSELKEELEAQGLPTDGTRNVLYQRVQKARRINRSRGRPLWVPPVEEEEEEVDEELDELISRIKLEEGNTEFWRRRFLGEGLNNEHRKAIDLKNSEDTVVFEDATDVEDVSKEVDDDEADEEEEDTEQTESQVEDRVKDKEVEASKPPPMIGVQLLKDSDMTATTSGKSKKKIRRMAVEDDDDEDWFPEDIHEALKELRNRKVFDVSDIYTIADAWGWTWERELKNKPPRRWSQEWEVELAVKVLLKVIELGGTPTIGDCAMILRAAVRAPMPSAFLKILQTTHSLNYVFGSPLYDEIITLCLDIGELDAAVAIVADLETSGITVPDETLDRVISARQRPDNTVDDAS
ncbi:Pentatricopeptide repeat-containing protein [Actinidia chinensis var. chinensis]|uniref:Pentatricopeptide repeat-containing protein n=1 Tax=Actinidia chinensis var. chinensis TaxID=1590841 RepID=A0A2R6PL49_ACTCC|nr:Pentatricopeptide repeat-containing protein [Actinidia chinensis var. chinensis]